MIKRLSNCTRRFWLKRHLETYASEMRLNLRIPMSKGSGGFLDDRLAFINDGKKHLHLVEDDKVQGQSKDDFRSITLFRRIKVNFPYPSGGRAFSTPTSCRRLHRGDAYICVDANARATFP